MKAHFGLKLAITIGALILVAAHLIWPSLTIDAITLGLLIVAVLPWLSAIIESAKFPGGWEIKFRDIQAAGQKVVASSPAAFKAELTPRPSYLEVAETDSNLALVGLRIEIEKRLRALAEKYQVKDNRSVMRVFDELRRQGVFNESSLSGLQELVMAGNQAAHGARVEANVANWAFDYGPKILATLDAKLENLSSAT